MNKNLKKALVATGVGLVGLAGVSVTNDTMSQQEIVQVEKHAQEIFGKNDAKTVERMIFNEMRPPTVKVMGRGFGFQKKGWKLEGKNFKSTLREKADDGWTYEEKGKELTLKSHGMSFDGKKVKTKANSVVGKIAKGKVQYDDALGTGLDIKIIQDNYRFQKIIEIESLESLGAIPEDAEYLEFSFKVSGDFNLPEGEITERIPFGENSFLNPIRAWDSSEPIEEEDPNLMSGAFGEIEGNVITKKIPVSWLKTATFPVSTDIDITFGSISEFSSSTVWIPSVTILDSTHFVVVYNDPSDTYDGVARVGVMSGTTISSYGTAVKFSTSTIYNYNSTTLDSTHFVVAYTDNVAGTRSAIVGSVSGTTISFGSANEFDSGGGSYTNVDALDSTHFVVVFDGTDNYGTAIVGVTDGSTTISSYGSANVFESAVVNTPYVAALDSTHFVVSYADTGNSTYGTAIVGVVSGTTISSYGSANVFNSQTTQFPSIDTIDSTHFIVAYNDNNASLSARIGTVSGTTISSYGTESSIVGSQNSNARIGVAVLGSTTFTVTYKDTNNSGYGTARIGTMSGATISGYGTANVFTSVSINDPSTTAISSTLFISAYRDTTGDVIIGSVPEATATDNALFFGAGF